MRVDVTVTGFDDLQKRIAELPLAVSHRVQVQALKKGAEPIRASASALAPRDEAAGAPHMADHIVVKELTGARRDAEGIYDGAAVEIGPLAKFFYAYFQEIGTAFHPAKAFMRPAFDSGVRRAQAIIRADLWASIRKRLSIPSSTSTTGRGV